jgi:hypothetical protein
MSETYCCDKHGTAVLVGEACPDCMEAFANRRDPSTMTAEERASEFEWWGDILTIPFNDLHKRIEELAGRSVWTHELANPKLIIQEIRSQQPATMSDVLDKLPGDKPIIIIDPEPRP